jgi:hypothetical protein
MPQPRLVKRIVNALANQGRVIYHLHGCMHTVSVTLTDIRAAAGSLEYYLEAQQVVCPHCPDVQPPTPAEIRQAQTPRQLWREAGEP